MAPAAPSRGLSLLAKAEYDGRPSNDGRLVSLSFFDGFQALDVTSPGRVARPDSGALSVKVRSEPSGEVHRDWHMSMADLSLVAMATGNRHYLVRS